jgi:hypothetical protein
VGAEVVTVASRSAGFATVRAPATRPFRVFIQGETIYVSWSPVGQAALTAIPRSYVAYIFRDSQVEPFTVSRFLQKLLMIETRKQEEHLHPSPVHGSRAPSLIHDVRACHGSASQSSTAAQASADFALYDIVTLVHAQMRRAFDGHGGCGTVL